MDELDLRSLIAEALGAFTLSFAGISAIVMTQGENLVAIALAHGLAIGLMFAAMARISGGHFNPAITVGAMATGQIKPIKGVEYIVAQLLGAVLGAGAVTFIFPDAMRNADNINLGLPMVGAGYTTTNALIMEAILSFFLMAVVMGAAVDKHSAGRFIAPLAIGLTITMDVLAGGAVSGAAMNPSRWFGAAAVQQDFTDGWIWIVGPVVGMLAAVFLFQYLLGKPERAVAEISDIDVAVEEVRAVPPKRRSSRR